MYPNALIIPIIQCNLMNNFIFPAIRLFEFHSSANYRIFQKLPNIVLGSIINCDMNYLFKHFSKNHFFQFKPIH